jgi:tetratricopeptide (TPR) repeat protein
LQLLGRIGPFYRILGELDLAEGYPRRAVELARATADVKAEVLSKLRLAHVLEWRGRFPEADSMYLDCLAMCEVEPALGPCLRACCRHYGKSLFEQGRHQEAAVQFKRALGLRRKTGDAGLTAWSELALEAVEARLGTGYPVDAISSL